MGMRFAALLATIAAMLLSGCSTPTRPPTPTTSPTAFIATPELATPTPTPTATPSPTATTTGLTSTIVDPKSVTFISPEDGWVLGLSMCGTASCLRLAKTGDAGKTWTWVNSDNVSTISPSDQWHIRFADGENGWISGPALYSTHDAGLIWTRVALTALDGLNASVGALETADGRVYAEISEGIEPNTDGPVVLFGSRTAVDTWYSVPAVTTGAAGFAGNISVADGVYWISLHPALVTAQGSDSLSTLYRSVDGITWRSEPQPCPSDTVASIAAATATRVFVVCAGGVAAGSQVKTAYGSDNSGANYERVTDPPFDGDFDAVAASPTSISVVASSGGSEIDTSFDNGQTWTTPLDLGDGGLGLSDVGFTTATQGVAIHGRIEYPDSLQLFMTRDGGHQWSAVAVNPI